MATNAMVLAMALFANCTVSYTDSLAPHYHQSQQTILFSAGDALFALVVECHNIANFSGALLWPQYRPNTMNLFNLKFSASVPAFQTQTLCLVKLLKFFIDDVLDKALTQKGYASAVFNRSRFHFDRVGKLNSKFPIDG